MLNLFNKLRAANGKNPTKTEKILISFIFIVFLYFGWFWFPQLHQFTPLP